MELIKIFAGMLFIMCLFLNTNLTYLQDLVNNKIFVNSNVDVSSPLGVTVEDFRGRVKVVDVLSFTPAMNSGLEPGDRILKVNNVKINSVKNFFEIMEITDLTKPVTMLVYRVDSCSTFPVVIRSFNCTCKE